MKKQSQRAKEKNEAERTAEQTDALGQAPSKKSTANPAARTTPNVEAASSSTSAGAWLDDPAPAAEERNETVESVMWYGSWYQKIICYGRTEWEQW